MRQTFLTVQEAADLMGVSSSTFKRLCDTASIPIVRTPGGHRRIERMDLDRLAPKILRTHQNSNPRSALKSNISADAIYDLMLQDRPFEIAKLFSRSSKTPFELIAALEENLIPALWRLGQKWRDDKIEIYQEHLCTNTALSAIDTLRAHFKTESENAPIIAVGCALAPNSESLSSKLVSLCLAIAGLRSLDFGSCLPPESLAKAARDFKVQFVWVTHTHVNDVESALESHHVLKAELPEGVRVVVGGGGISPGMRRSLPWCEYYESISQLVTSESRRLTPAPTKRLRLDALHKTPASHRV